VKYRAFISYRRQDASAAARWLREKLLGFRPPAELLDRVTPERRVDLERRVAYFLDTSYQTASEDFWTANIEPALRESEHLIVISSPSALQARADGSDNWVAREIDTFLKIRGEEEGRRRIIIVLAAGAPDDRFPGRLDSLGTQWDWSDLRGVSRFAWARPGTAERLGDALLKIVARIHQVPQELLPILRQEEARKRGRLRVAVAAAAAAVIVGLSALSWWAVSAESEASRQRDEARVREARFLARTALTELDRHRHNAALALALEALPRDMARPDRAYAPEAERVAQASLQSTARQVREWLGDLFWSRPTDRDFAEVVMDVAADGRRLLLARPDDTMLVVDTGNGEVVATLPRHDQRISSFALSRDGRRAMSASFDGTIRIWALDVPGQPYRVFKIDGGVRHAALSADGARVLAVGDGRVIHVFDVETRRLSRLEHEQVVGLGIFSPDGTRVLARTEDVETHLWQLGTEPSARVMKTRYRALKSVAFSPDGRWLLFSIEREGVFLVDGDDKLPSKVLASAPTYGRGLFSPDGRHVLSLGSDGVELWTVPDGRRVWQTKLGGAAYEAAFAPDGKTMFVSFGRQLAVLDAEKGTERMVLSGHGDDIMDIAVSDDGTRVLTASADRTARLWDVASGAVIASLVHEGHLVKGWLSPDGSRVATAAEEGRVSLWHVAGQPDGPVLLAPPDQIRLRSARVSPDGRFLAGASSYGDLHVWAMPAGAIHRHVQRAHADQIRRAVFSADGRRIATASEDGTAAIWSFPEVQPIARLVAFADKKRVEQEKRLVDVALSRDGTLALTGAHGGSVKLWDVARPQRERLVVPHHPDDTLTWGDLRCVAISADATRLLASSQRRTTLADAADGRTILTFDQHQLACAVFSPDGRLMLASGRDGRAIVFAAADGSEIGALGGHAGQIKGIVFAPRGDHVLTLDDEVVRVWSMPGRQLLATLRGHADRLEGAAFSADGTRVLTNSRDGTARVWLVATAQAIASYRLHGPFDPDEDLAFLPSGEHVMLMHEGVARIWRHIGSTQAVIDRGCAALARPLDPPARRDAFLDEDPKTPPCGWHPDMKARPPYTPKAARR